MQLPEFATYGRYSNKNYGAHALVFTDTNGDEFFFSYKTLVAFRTNGALTVMRNYWGPTTGKHLNAICEDHKSRLTDEEFKAAFKRAFP